MAQTNKPKKSELLEHLDYYIAEGFAVKYKDEDGEIYVRLKTKAELKKELKDLEDSYE